MKPIAWGKIMVVVVLAVAILGVVALKISHSARELAPVSSAAPAAPAPIDSPPAVAPKTDKPAPTPKPEQLTPVATTPKTAVAEQPRQPATPTPRVAAPTPTAKPAPSTAPTVKTTDPPAPAPMPAAQPAALPEFIELGSDQCVPCRMMQPVLAQLRHDYPHTLRVTFIDVWKNPRAARTYNVDSIPTQIILVGGTEVYRHVGFWPVDEIVAQFKKLGVAL